MTPKIKVGSKVFLKPIGNAARRSTEIIETEVATVGRKYFTVSQSWYGRFFIDTMVQNAGQYISNYVAYSSLQEIEEEMERHVLAREIRELIHANMRIDILRSIHQILKPKA